MLLEGSKSVFVYTVAGKQAETRKTSPGFPPQFCQGPVSTSFSFAAFICVLTGARILQWVSRIKCIFLQPISEVVMFQQSKCRLRKQTFVSRANVFTQRHLIPPF